LIFDPDIFRGAKLLMDRHGEKAPLRAAERADQLVGAGDMVGATAWRRILKAVEELQRRPRKGERVN
jgi:hypothetical protein